MHGRCLLNKLPLRCRPFARAVSQPRIAVATQNHRLMVTTPLTHVDTSEREEERMTERLAKVWRRWQRPRRHLNLSRALAASLSGRAVAGVSLVMCAVLLGGLIVSAIPHPAAAQETPKRGGTLTAAIGSDPVNLAP